MTLSSRHRIRNSSPGGLRPSTLPLGHVKNGAEFVYMNIALHRFLHNHGDIATEGSPKPGLCARGLLLFRMYTKKGPPWK